MISVLETIKTTGLPLEDVASGLSNHIRNLIIASVENSENLLELNDEHKKQYLSNTQNWNGKDLLRIVSILNDLEYKLKKISQNIIVCNDGSNDLNTKIDIFFINFFVQICS